MFSDAGGWEGRRQASSRWGSLVTEGGLHFRSSLPSFFSSPPTTISLQILNFFNMFRSLYSFSTLSRPIRTLGNGSTASVVRQRASFALSSSLQQGNEPTVGSTKKDATPQRSRGGDESGVKVRLAWPSPPLKLFAVEETASSLRFPLPCSLSSPDRGRRRYRRCF